MTKPVSTKTAPRSGTEIRVYVSTYFLSVVAEFASFLAVLVYAFDRGGAHLTGFASIAMLIPYVLVAPFTARWAQLYRPRLVRRTASAVQVAGYAVAGAAALGDLPVVWPVVGCMFAFGAMTALRPSGAVLLPSLVHSTRDLTTANLWSSYAESSSILVAPLMATGLLAIGRAPAVLAGCACATAISLAISLSLMRVNPPAPNDFDFADRANSRPFRGVLRHGLSGLQRLSQRPGLLSVLGAETAQYVLIGALDVILVVVANESLHMSKTGTGVLTSLVGLGTFLSTAAAGRAVRRKALAPLIVLGLTMLAA